MGIGYVIKRYRKDALITNFALTMTSSLPLLAIINFVVNHGINIWIFPLTFLNSFLSGFYLKISKFLGINLAVFFEFAISCFLLIVFIFEESPLLLISIALVLAIAHKLSRITEIGIIMNYSIAFFSPLLDLFLFNEQLVVQNTFISSFMALVLEDILRSRMIDEEIIENFNKKLSFSGDENILVLGGLGGFDSLYSIPLISTFINFFIIYILNIHIPFTIQKFVG
ncbi:hypothetical protein [Saccharolobus shibatae]|uniref:Uncharacterized protein n=1 Tax=Saccharolobus shibatae TaxID=2286 RepID=A0A8F5GZP6_9CREN|nr:hypothetical protein [Saccharolobus shibatae]QXJ32287.1 hypothetical protein J5U21_01938 [Saccharolobus shibatae]QXJ35326.1 hypothetical protein J5U22_01873 [Saccharolobus shibatae]